MPNDTLADGQTLKNKRGAGSRRELEERDVDRVKRRALAILLATTMPQSFDADHLKAIHRHLFRDVYAWAGHTRDEQVVLSEGTVATEALRPGGKPFPPGREAGKALGAMSRSLQDMDDLRDRSRLDFAV